MAVRELQEFLATTSKLFSVLSEAEPGLAVVYARKATACLEQLLRDFEKARESWRELPLEEKAEEEITSVVWIVSKDGEGEYTFADGLPNLVRLLREKGGKARLGHYVYYLSSSGRTVTRYPRKR